MCLVFRADCTDKGLQRPLGRKKWSRLNMRRLIRVPNEF